MKLQTSKNTPNIESIKRFKIPSELLIVLAIISFDTLFRVTLELINLPPSLSGITNWLIIITTLFYNRKVTYSLLTYKTLTSFIFILTNAHNDVLKDSAGNAMATTVITFIMIITVSEFIFHSLKRFEQMNNDLRKANKKAIQAAKAKDSFLANMSHEIRTPISGIIGISQMMLSETTDTADIRNLKLILNSSDSLLHIVNNILDFSKLEADKESFKKESFNIHSMVTELHRNFISTTVNSPIKIHLDIDQNVPKMVNSDKYKIRQILNNLISNAIKFTQKGNISISIKQLSSTNKVTTIKFKIKDSGIGIPEDKINSLFKEFEQIDNSYSKYQKGTGLGLAITKRLIEGLGGEINVKSTLGEGSEFSFLLALELSSQHEKNSSFVQGVPEYQVYNKSNKTNMKLLLAEDNTVNQIYLKHFLEKRGYTISLAENGKIATEKFMEDSFNAILMDIQMPIMSGLDATKIIRDYEEKNSSKATPILALTASVTHSDKEMFLNSGMDYFCPKPVDIQHLLQILDEIEHKQLTTAAIPS